MKKSMLLIFMLSFLVAIMMTACSNNEEAAGDGTENSQSEGGDSNDSQGEGSKITDVSEITEFHQAPMFDELDLPAVTERLPNVPKLTNEMPEDVLDYEIGQYGGTLNTVTAQVDWDADFFVVNNEPLLNTPGILGEEITPNILEDFEMSDDQKEFTFYLREGLHWSDGEPVTMEDFRFAIEDVIFNEEITPIVPTWLKSAGDASKDPFEFEVIDDWTFKMTFSEPYGGFPMQLAITNWRGYADLLKPAHYLKEYHKEYADPDELQAMLDEEGYDEDQWVSLFGDYDITEREFNQPKSQGFPVLNPWMTKEISDTYYLFERNPYYFKVDAAGNQLPYIDEVRSNIVQDSEMIGLKVIAGEIDLSRENSALPKMPLYKENEEKGGYIAHTADMHLTPSDIFFNLTYEDDVWREVVQDKRFRQAVNHAINREEIIDSIYYGFAEPSTWVDSTFDVDKANQLLDEMGMERGSDGYRLGPDGKRFTVPFEIAPFAPDFQPLAELLVEYLGEVGIHATTKTLDQALWSERDAANQLQASIMWTHTVAWYMNDFGQARWGKLWNEWWNSNGEKGEEPPEDVKEFYQILNRVNVSTVDEALQAVEELKQNMNDNVWQFIHIENVKQPVVLNAELGNVTADAMAIGVNFSGEQWFYKK
ncbi:ABC transporter substrate-binding protein [Gracilibacillus alcaliphilus]|uniref:ABC transporter substrate-binding protein n=1 Tax=Gracilibacillus alcaliphilus TaxID=1401441 RepID=UPI00195986E0|nr:ABC transporter substrate-binding protein [Gracilibacillus alcaliphilus]MBM7677854.1 peptide/nickel transport system substrate-binding protein [Gracilibacillus alcaliphilus]